MITLKNVGKNYGEKKALSEVTLSIEKGEMIAVMGPSGSGKTTLLNIIGCMDRMDEGEYLFDDTDVSSLKGSRLDKFRAENVGFVFQQYHLIPSMNVLENVMLPLRYAGVDKRDRRELAELALQKVGLAERMNHRPHELSGGQKQRVAIARATVTKPKIILADGIEIKCTADHPILTESGYKQAADLNSEDKIIEVYIDD